MSLRPPPVHRQRLVAGQPRFEYLLLEERRGGTEDLPEDNPSPRGLAAVGRHPPRRPRRERRLGLLGVFAARRRVASHQRALMIMASDE